MARDINLTSQEWCDIVFESKNKEYGAYEMRQSSSRRHLAALLVIVGLAALLAVLPALVKNVATEPEGGKSSGALGGDSKVTQVDIPVKDLIELPPPPVKATVQYMAPIMVASTDLDETNRLISQTELLGSNIEISFATVEGVGVVMGEGSMEAINKIVEEDPTIYPIVDVQAVCSEDLFKYIGDNLRYPPISIENGVQGRVVVRFVVNINGDVSNVEILQSLDAACDKEAIRIVQSMPKWIPGRKNGVAVNSYFVLPIVYRLQTK